jgi:hypothetical protein
MRAAAAERDGSSDPTMTRQFTDAENTGAPIVPMTEQTAETVTGGGAAGNRQFLEEMVWSHRR